MVNPLACKTDMLTVKLHLLITKNKKSVMHVVKRTAVGLPTVNPFFLNISPDHRVDSVGRCCKSFLTLSLG